MKKILIIGLVITISMVPAITFAAALGLPFGGLVLTTHIPPNVTCMGDLAGSPFTIKPVTVSPPSPWSASTLGLVHVGLIAPGAYILGMYLPVLDQTNCLQTSTGSSPYPTFMTNFYGTSLSP